MLKSIIVDDELKSRQLLKKMLRDYFWNVEVNATCQNVSEAIESIEKYKPDLVFLDIELKGESGFKVLTKLTDVDFEVVFLTTNARYALQAIKFSALDYLLKPIHLEDLRRAISKAEKRNVRTISVELRNFVRSFMQDTLKHRKLALPNASGMSFVKVSDILYCKASGNYTEIFLTSGKKYLISRQIKEFEQLLNDCNFFRIHNSFLVNMDHIQRYVKSDGGYVVMSDNTSLDISRRKKELFLERMDYKSLKDE